MQRSKRERASAVLSAPALRPIVRRLPRWPGILILNYHRVGARDAEPWDRALYNADASLFESQIEALSSTVEIVALHDVAQLARARTRGRMILITFDDGYRDNYEVAFPILRRHGASAGFFVSTGYLDRPHVPWWDEIAWMVRHCAFPAVVGVPYDDALLSLAADEIESTIATLIEHYKGLPGEQTDGYIDRIAVATGSGRCDVESARSLWMTWDMVREMRDAGMAIGGHTDSHPILSRLGAQEQEREVSHCAQRLGEELGSPMRWFAYPVGSRDSFTPTTRRILGDHGVELAFSFYGGFASFQHWTPLDVPRIHVPYGATPALLEASLRLPMVFART
jgi:peptidoglycan/xylan/chitin deacetylase (PgdA/CDA1 family)